MSELLQLDTIVYTDVGRDSDDTLALILGRIIRKETGCAMKAVITTLTPAFRRAQLALQFCRNLGVSTRVAAGGDLPDVSAESVKDYEFAGLPDDYGLCGGIWTPESAHEETFAEAEDNSLNLLVISGFTELAKELDRCIQEPKLLERFKRKVNHLVVMGGVLTENGEFALDEDGLIQIDNSANYEFDREAARKVIRFAQLNGIPIRFVSRHAAYAAKLSRDTYVKAGQTGNEVGTWLENAVASGFRSLWERANQPADTPNRALPARCDRNWFVKTFCSGNEVPDGKDIWEYITGVVPYDPLAMIATRPELVDAFYMPKIINIHGTNHEIIGFSPEENGVKNPDELVGFLSTAIIRGLEVPQPTPVKHFSQWDAERLGGERVKVSGVDGISYEYGPDRVLVPDGNGGYVVKSYRYEIDGDRVIY